MYELEQQLFCLFMFFITGIIIGIVFDIFRILRKSFKTTDLITYLQDILFWIIAGSIILFSIFVFNNGEIRSYIFIGIILGVIIYFITISKLLIKYSVSIVTFIKKRLSKLFVSFKKWFQRIFVNPTSKLYNKLKNTKQLQNMTKNSKTQQKTTK